MESTLGYLVFKSYPEYQILATALVVLVAALPVGGGLLRRLGQWMERAGRHAAICGAGLFVASLAIVALLAVRRGVPMAYVHDEFSYLLAADTFAHGRLTNPTPPAWQHFESMHILVRPSYQSKYPPGQGLVMALGEVAFGEPIAGVWLSTAAAVLAIYWALGGYLPARWALAGGMLAAIHPQVLEWGQRYWGGCVALAGGALVFGAAGRLVRRIRVNDSIWGGIGVVVLALSRPFEGAVFTLVMAGWLLGSWRRRGDRTAAGGWRARLMRGVLPGMAVVGAGLVWLGYYNYRVTGHALRLPYVEHQAQYGAAPLFIFEPAVPMEKWPKYNNPQMLQFARDQNYDHARRRSWKTLWRGAVEQLSGMAITAFGNVSTLALPLLILPSVLMRDRRLRRMLTALGVFALAMLVETYMLGHYVAPAGALVLTITLMGTRWMWRGGGVGGRLVVRASTAVALVWCVFWWIGFSGWMQKTDDWKETRQPWYVWRDYIAHDFLAKQAGRQLAIVRYKPDHFVHHEWVYNGADLEDAKVIWARDLGEHSNRELLKAFPDRTPWLVEPDGDRLDPIPYTEARP